MDISKKQLQTHYKDPKFPGAFAGVDTFYKALKNIYPNIKRKKVVEFLKSEDSYTLHKPVTRPRIYRRVFTKGIDYLYEIDLVDVSRYREENDNYTFLVTLIDTFSKYAWVVPILTKHGKNVFNGVKTILLVNRPKKISMDLGLEFFNKDFLHMLKVYNIQYYSVASNSKNPHIERFNRSLKTRLFRAFTARGNHRYIDILPDIVDAYNNSYHRSIKMAPNQVSKENEAIVRKNLYPKIVKTLYKNKVKIGDTVRIARKKGAFDKGYSKTFSDEVYYVNKIKNTYPVTYGLTDVLGEPIRGSFYFEEIQVVDKTNNIYPIEKIITSRTRRGIKEHLVKFLGYSDESNTWIPHKDIFGV